MKIKKFLSFIFYLSSFILLLLVLSASPVSAALFGGPQTQPGGPPGVAPGGYDPIGSVTQEVFGTNEMNKGSYDADTVLRTIPASLTIGILGTTSTSVSGVKTYHPGAVTFLAGAIGTLYDVPPVSGKEYFASLGQNLGLVQPAYAQQNQGFGFEKLKPVLGVWQVMRNIVYLFFVIVFVIVGFMIMFRIHIDPRTVVSIQLALPQIIVALLLVTFSYAIAGLLVDLTELSIRLVLNIFSGFSTVPGYQEIARGENIFGIMWSLVGGYMGAVFKMVNDTIGQVVTGTIGSIGGFLGGGIIALIFSIAILIAMFRLFLSLLIAYITIILLTIFAPFMFLISAIPGRGNIWGWFKNMLANILVFPAVAGLFIIAGILTKSSEQFGVGEGWQAPFLGITAQTATGLIGLGMILIAPKIPDLIKEAFQIKTSPLIGQAFRETAGPAAGFVGGRIAQPVSGIWGRFVGERQEAGRKERTAYREHEAAEQRRQRLGLPSRPY